MWNAVLFWNVIVGILIPSMCDGPISIYPWRTARVTRRSPSGASVNRCQEAGGARDWKANGPSSDERTRHRRSGTEIRRPAAAAIAAVSRTARFGQRHDGADGARIRRSGRYRGWKVAAAPRFRLWLPSSDVPAQARSASAKPAAIAGAAWRPPRGNARTTAQTGSRARTALAASLVLTCFRNHFIENSRPVPRGGQGLSAVPMLYYNIGSMRWCQPWPRTMLRRSSV